MFQLLWSKEGEDIFFIKKILRSELLFSTSISMGLLVSPLRDYSFLLRDYSFLLRDYSFLLYGTTRFSYPDYSFLLYGTTRFSSYGTTRFSYPFKYFNWNKILQIQVWSNINTFRRKLTKYIFYYFDWNDQI